MSSAAPTPAPTPAPTSSGGTPAPGGSSSHDASTVDNAKAVAIPVMMIFALILCVFFTRHSLTTAWAGAKSDFRKMLLFGGAALTTIVSIFLMPSAAWSYGIVSALLAYMSALACSPGILEANVNRIFVVYVLWFLVLVGMPDLILSTGIVAQTAECDKWFKNDDADGSLKMCKAGWVTFNTLCAMVVVILNFFSLIALLSMVFHDGEKDYTEIQDSVSAAVPQQTVDANSPSYSEQPTVYQN